MIIIILAIFLFSIASVCASDTNDTAIASEDTTAIELSQSDDITVTDESQKTIQTNDTEMLTASDEETTAAQNNLDTLSLEEKTYADLSNAVGSGGDINLQPAYYKYNGESDTISITNPGIINGNGAIIDMAGSTIRALTVNAKGVTIKNLTIKNANYNGNGGAIYFSQSGSLTNCNFTNNQATGDGGAIYFDDGSTGSLTNCNFTNNKAFCNGGAILTYSGTVENCNFVNNTASNEGGGAIFFAGSSNFGIVENCDFTNNSAYWGGAVYFEGYGNVTNCNFNNNKATGGVGGDGGAILINSGTVTNCNFTNNTAINGDGGAIYTYFEVTADSCIFKTDSDSYSQVLIIPPTLNVNNLTTFYGSGEKLSLDLKTNSSMPVYNGNISISVYYKDNNSWVENYSCLSGEGWIPDLPVGSYYAIFNTEYAEFQSIIRTIKIIPNIKFYVNVTSQTTNNKTVNITAISNIYSEVMPGKLLFIVPNTDPINATYAGNGTWWAVYTFDNAGDYNVNASYIGLDNVTINNATISIRFDASVEVNNKTLDLLIGDTFTVVATTTPEGLKVSFVPDDSGVYSIDENGNVIALRDGEGSILIKVGDDGIYAKNSTIVNVTVSKVPTEITANDVTTTYNSNKDLVITLKDSTGKALSGVKVTVDLNGAKTYTTDSNGQVKVPTKGLAPKTYTVKIAFNGNTKYVKSVKEVKVTVKKATPKITAKKKTFKATTKTKKYTITLKDNTGKAIKNAKVTLKVNGKTYKATTNSKGKATFKITKLNKKGTYKATVTYKGNKYYNKATKKVKITVKASKTKKSTFKTVSQGSKDTKTVKKIQQALKDNGYYLTYQGHYLKVDGKYESCTVRSVKEFQHDKGLKVTGKVDEKTAKKLKII